MKQTRLFALTKKIFLVAACTAGAPSLAQNYLYPDGRLHQGQFITSASGKYTLVMQIDGNLVMYDGNGRVRYHFPGPGNVAVMQTDGNFVEYSLLGNAVWHTNTWGNPGSLMHIQDDGNLVVYNRNWIPLWQLGPMPSPKDPRLAAEVVARDLNSPAGGALGWLGHTALYDGKGSVIQATYVNGNAIRTVPLNTFKIEEGMFWGTASPNIPSGRTVSGCYQTNCYSAGQFQQFEMREAIVRAAQATGEIGASYTLTAQWQPARWGNRISMPVRGTYRCDTFVLAMLAIPPYESTSPARVRWKTFIEQFAYRDEKNPKLVFDRLGAYR